MPKARKGYYYEYGLYKGDTFIDVGTKEYLAKTYGMKPSTVAFLSSNSNKKRMTKYDNRLITVKIEVKKEDVNG